MWSQLRDLKLPPAADPSAQDDLDQVRVTVKPDMEVSYCTIVHFKEMTLR